MSPPSLEELLSQAQSGQLSWSALAEQVLQQEHASDAEHRPDLDRVRRCGFGEVIFGSGKSVVAIEQIATRLLGSGQCEVLVTRVDSDAARAVSDRFEFSRFDALGRTLRLSRREIELVQRAPSPPPHDADSPALPRAPVAIVTAGSTDIGVAREAFETLGWMGIEADLITDVGVAGPYRLLAHLERLRQCVAIVVIAGMEGALASVVGGLVPCPVVAVPTSVGYGSNFEGITTLLSMMSSCAAGVTVVNIDGGFKGGYVAGLIAAGQLRRN